MGLLGVLFCFILFCAVPFLPASSMWNLGWQNFLGDIAGSWEEEEHEEEKEGGRRRQGGRGRIRRGFPCTAFGMANFLVN